ncbi:MAG: DNA-directed RNA polymerase subunit D [Candidatus Diapherotrites archaeon]|uniref:DNA-directed RNA polymerase subunit Rpo3 n=1 Tax=Candidatus Iainarchaeum sp. TaxID=3101447 RepID=A0A8T4L651_9ARCH|nr:DNA-directed RNA polymerase subunit D [Candidatus Diapherotrites archaeon]
MDVKKISDNGKELKLLINGTDTAMMNALRRTIMNSVPVLAIDKVWFYDNNSVMTDEMLSHRLGLLSVKGVGKVTEGENAKFALEKEGPGMVYSGEIICSTGNAEIVDKKIPVVLLGKNQRVRMEMEAVVGTGKMHTKWQPGTVTYYQVPKVTFEGVKDPEAIQKAFPGTIEVKAKKLFLADPLNAKQVTELRDRFPEEVKLDYDDKSFVMIIETNRGKENAEIIEDSLEALRNRNKEFKEALKSL